ncbi:MAG: winged helix-turn-helix domain-containing protein [Clostridia bacterium]
MVIYKVNPLLEAMSYFLRRANKCTVKEYSEQLIANNSHEAEKLYEKMIPVLELETQMNKKIEFTDRHIYYFFGFERKLIHLSEPTLASLILPMPSPKNDFNLKEIEDSVKNMTPQEMRYDIMLFLAPEEMKKYNNPELVTADEYLKFIGRLSFSAEIKWSLADLHANFESRVEELFSLMRPAIDIIIENENIYASAIKNFEMITPQSFDGNSLVQSDINAKYPSKSETTVYPYIFGYNCAVLYNPSAYKEPLKNDLYIGVLYNVIRLIKDSERFATIMPQTMKILADKSKYEILSYLGKHSAYGQELSNKFNLSTPTISQHMAKLYNAGLITSMVNGNKVYYIMNKKNIKLFIKQLKTDLLGK